MITWYVLNRTWTCPMLLRYAGHWSVNSVLIQLFLRVMSAVLSPAEVLECSLHYACERCLQGGKEITGAHNEFKPTGEHLVVVSGSPLPHSHLGPGQSWPLIETNRNSDTTNDCVYRIWMQDLSFRYFLRHETTITVILFGHLHELGKFS